VPTTVKKFNTLKKNGCGQAWRALSTSTTCQNVLHNIQTSRSRAGTSTSVHGRRRQGSGEAAQDGGQSCGTVDRERERNNRTRKRRRRKKWRAPQLPKWEVNEWLYSCGLGGVIWESMQMGGQVNKKIHFGDAFSYLSVIPKYILLFISNNKMSLNIHINKRLVFYLIPFIHARFRLWMHLKVDYAF
jgi:hypothetical protein